MGCAGVGVRVSAGRASRDSRIRRCRLRAAPALARGQLARALAGVSPLARIAIGGAVAVALRWIVIILNKLPLAGAGASVTEPRLFAVAIVVVAAGMLAGLVLASRRRPDSPASTATLAGGLIGVLAAAVGLPCFRASSQTRFLVGINLRRRNGIRSTRRFAGGVVILGVSVLLE